MFLNTVSIQILPLSSKTKGKVIGFALNDSLLLFFHQLNNSILSRKGNQPTESKPNNRHLKLRLC